MRNEGEDSGVIDVEGATINISERTSNHVTISPNTTIDCKKYPFYWLVQLHGIDDVVTKFVML